MPKLRRYVATQALPANPVSAFDYHERPGALNRLIPPWETVTIESSDRSLKPGSRVVLKTSVGGVPLRWVAEHTEYDPPNLFADRQISGPFETWNHQHRFETRERANSDHPSQLIDQIDYRLPLGALGDFFGSVKARRTIEAMFAYRHQVTHDDLRLMHDYPLNHLRVAVSGSNGLVGKAFCNLLNLFGHEVRSIVRGDQEESNQEAPWSRNADQHTLSGLDAVVHLAGKSIADGRWNQTQKAEIRDSRVEKTRQLCELLATRKQPPKVLVCASATGIYGDRGDEILDEQSPLGESTANGAGFLAQVGKEWEEACQPARDAGIRVVHARFGIILSPRGGALQKMLTPAKLMGGSLGSGKQWWSWIGLDDALGALYHCIQCEQVHGAVNLVTPSPIQNRDFTRELGRVIGRPALFPAPKPILRLALGEMADALLLSSARVIPQKLLDSNYHFRFTDLGQLLRYSLGRNLKHSEA